jgi:hypothetical protein
MKSARSTIFTGAILACACQAVSAQDFTGNVTVTQQGNGNTSYAEQAGGPSFPVRATITIAQAGNDNHVGGPGAAAGGVLQLDNGGLISALIQQTGAGNNAGITQTGNGGALPNSARITQLGTGNSALLRQYSSSDSSVAIDQSGAGNVADVAHNGGTASLRTSQNGVGNRLTIDYNNGPFGGPNVTQDGEGNTTTVIGYGVTIGGAPLIEQSGSFNSVITVQNLLSESSSQIRQDGNGNGADATQTGDFQRLSLDQAGDGNLASVSQTGMGTGGINDGNSVIIAQLGNSNTAIVRQAGFGYRADVNQVGANNYTGIYQH